MGEEGRDMAEQKVRPEEALWRLGIVPAVYMLDIEPDGMVDLSRYVSEGEASMPDFSVVRPRTRV